MSARLDLGKVVAGAFLVPWWRRRAFARALVVPVLLIFAYSVAWEYLRPTVFPWLTWLVACGTYGLLFTLFAVRCHRLVLLDPQAVAREWQPRWTWRETRFFMWVAGFWLFGIVGMVVLLTVVLNAWGAIAGHRSIELEWTEQAVRVALLYPFGRLCVMFPATAVERPAVPDVRWAWQLTRGNGWRLMIVVGALPWLFSLLTSAVYRSEATTLEWVLVGLLGLALLAVQIAALSISYQELTKKA